MTTDTSEPSSSGRGWTRAELIELAASVAALGLVVRVFAVFAAGVEARPGALLRDPVLASLTPRDMTWAIFAVIYVSVAVGIASLAGAPRALIVAVRAYALMVLLRMLAMSVTPLEAPLGTIPLRDPFLQSLWAGKTLTRDLFFSGHTATLCILTFTARRPALRGFFIAAALVVGASVLLQAVHYTVDVLAAPVFSYAAYRIAWASSRHTLARGRDQERPRAEHLPHRLGRAPCEARRAPPGRSSPRRSECGRRDPS